jgi:hypothetical protein
MNRNPDAGRHTDWCARNHHCAVALGEHRAEPIALRIPGAGSAVLTRVRTADGTEHADIRLTITLPDNQPHARARLAALLTHLQTLIGPARGAHRPQRRAA